MRTRRRSPSPDQVVGHQGKSAKVTVVNTAASASVTLSPNVSSGFVVTSSTCPTVMRPAARVRFEVAFAPAAKGKQNGQLQLNSNAEFGVRAIKLKGKGLAPKMKTKPKSLSFEQTLGGRPQLPAYHHRRERQSYADLVHYRSCSHSAVQRDRKYLPDDRAERRELHDRGRVRSA